MNIGNPMLALAGVPLMALFCWYLSRWLPLLRTESREHAGTLPLDGLRGILAASVLFHHSYITYVFRQTGVWSEPASNFYGQLGPTAVTFFFFISGFLFWSKMLKDPDSLRVRRLWPNRLRRIMPAYWVAVIVAFTIMAFVSGFHRMQPVRTLITHAAPWIFVGFPVQLNINAVAQQPITAGVHWTLRVELLFYLVLPALVWFRRGFRPLLIVAAALLANLALYQWTTRNGVLLSVQDNLERFTNAVAGSFSIGALAAYLRIAAPRLPRVAAVLQSPITAALGVVLVMVQLFWIKGGYTWTEVVLLAPVFWMVALGNSFGGVLSSRPMRCLGEISYSVYVLHGLILFAVTAAVNRYAPIAEMSVMHYWLLILAISLIVVAVSTLNYWYVERPCFHRRRKPAANAERHNALRGAA